MSPYDPHCRCPCVRGHVHHIGSVGSVMSDTCPARTTTAGLGTSVRDAFDKLLDKHEVAASLAAAHPYIPTVSCVFIYSLRMGYIHHHHQTHGRPSTHYHEDEC